MGGKKCAVLTAALLVLGFLSGIAWAADDAKGWPNNVKIFNTMDFKTPIKGLPMWQRVIKQGNKDIILLSTCKGGEKNCPAAASRWQKLVAEIKDQPPMKQLQAVNKFFNAWPYRLDKDTFGINDYWATPLEFVRNSGDCEDYSIIKYYALKHLGWDPNNMRIVVLMDKILNLAHAILVVYLDGEVYVLDNQTAGVFPHSRFQHYEPQYSVNEFYKWAHVPARR